MIGRGDTKMSIRLGRGLQIDLRVVPAKSFGAALQYFTGSKDHNVDPPRHGQGSRPEDQRIRRVSPPVARHARLEDADCRTQRGELACRLPDRQIRRTIHRRPHRGRSLRHDGLAAAFRPRFAKPAQEFAWAAAGKLPQLIELTDLVGDLHMHTTASDGKATLARDGRRGQRARPQVHRDHRSLASASAWPTASTPTRLRAQWDEIDRLNREFDDFTILKGIECDILEKGGMDLPDDVLAEADWVIASVHYGQKQPREQITERILGVLENPHVSIIAHPTGRLIDRREPYAVDLEAVFAAAAKHGKLLELNANPARLDLDDVHLRRRQATRHPDRDQQRRPQHRRPRRAALRRAASPPRRPHGGRRRQHAAVARFKKCSAGSNAMPGAKLHGEKRRHCWLSVSLSQVF